jgi:hypothetical protein
MQGRGRWIIHHRGAGLIHGFLELHRHPLQGAQAPQRDLAGLAAMPFATKSALSRHQCFGQCPLCGAGSTGQRNTFRELVCWGLIEQGLSGPFIELPCYRAEFGLAM